MIDWRAFCKEWREKHPRTVAPEWSQYLTFAWPPLAWDGRPLPEVAVYDLEHQPTTYDFICWLVIVKTLGAKHVHFVYEGKIQDWKYSAAQAWKRFGNVIVPLAEMMGLPFTVGPKRYGFTVAYRWGHVESLYKTLGRIEKLPLVGEAHGHVTVTLRDTIKFQWKNSNRQAWERFAKHLEASGEKVIFLDDSDATGVILEARKRMELYSGAKVNLGGSGGPMSMCLFSEAPYLVMNLLPDDPQSMELAIEFMGHGFPPGSQFSFRNDRQLLSWEPDYYENIVKEYGRHQPIAKAA